MDYAQNAANRSSEKANSGNARPTNEKKQSDGTWQTVSGCGWKLYQTICSKNLTDPMVRTLLEKYQIHVNGSTSQAGKKFSASLILNPDNTVKFDFSQ